MCVFEEVGREQGLAKNVVNWSGLVNCANDLVNCAKQEHTEPHVDGVPKRRRDSQGVERRGVNHV